MADITEVVHTTNKGPHTWSHLKSATSTEREKNGAQNDNNTSTTKSSNLFSMEQQTLVGQGLLIIEASRSHSDTPHSVGLLWTRDRLNAETSTWQHTPPTSHPCLRRDSNSQSQQASDPRPTPKTKPGMYIAYQVAGSREGSLAETEGQIVTLFQAYHSSWIIIRIVGSGIKPAIPATRWPRYCLRPRDHRDRHRQNLNCLLKWLTAHILVGNDSCPLFHYVNCGGPVWPGSTVWSAKQATNQLLNINLHSPLITV
jgi:hypothetical protein